MSEENKPAEDEGKKAEFKAPSSQDEFDRMVADRLTRERSKFADYDDLKKKAAEYDKAQEASKSELQKEREARVAAEKERDSERVAGWRAQVALDKGLTPTQAKRLVGATKEELEADADELLKDLGATKPERRKPGSLKSGSQGGDDAGLTGKQKAAAALRAHRGGN